MARIDLKDASPAGNWQYRVGNLTARIVWEGRRASRRLGWSVLVGIFCFILACLMLWQTQLLWRQQRVLREQLSAVRSAAVIKPANDGRQDDVGRQLSAFYAYLPDHDMIPDQIKLLINLAEKNDVTLAQAEYKPQAELSADFLRYQIILPIKAEYPKIQAFILSALHEMPTLVLESVVFRRDRIESEEVEARVQYVLLVKKPVPDGVKR